MPGTGVYAQRFLISGAETAQPGYELSGHAGASADSFARSGSFAWKVSGSGFLAARPPAPLAAFGCHMAIYHSGFTGSADLVRWYRAGSLRGRLLLSGSDLVLRGDLDEVIFTVPASSLASCGLWQDFDFFLRWGENASAGAWVNGSLLLSGSGAIGSDLIDEIRLVGGNGSWHNYIWLDDLFAADVTAETSPIKLTAGRLTWLNPVADVSAQWQGSDGDSASNYLLVREALPSTYVATSSTCQIDRYRVETFTGASSVLGVIPFVGSAQIPFLQRSLYVGLGGSSASSLADPAALPAASRGVWYGFAQSIFTGATWSTSELANLELIIRSAD